jgi:hypothetical protein
MSLHPSKQYPSPAEVKIYIGPEKWIDDAYRIDYSVTNSRVPLYDYTSPYFKQVAEGNHIVQGQIIINYRFPGYLKRAFLKEMMRDSDFANDMKKQHDITRELIGKNPSERVELLLAAKKLGTFEATKMLSEDLFSSDKYTDFKDLSKDKLYMKKKIKDNSGVALEDVATSHTMYPFSIVIKYGGEESLYQKRIEHCVLLGESQVISASALAGGDLSASGMPIYEVYSFLGRKLIDVVTQKGDIVSNRINKISLSSTPDNLTTL